MNKKGFGMITWAVILLVLTVGFAVQQNPNSNAGEIVKNISLERVNITIEEQPELAEGISGFINGMMSLIEGITGWAADYAVEHPEVPWKLLIYLLIIGLLAPVIILLVKLTVIIVILTREFILSRREKRELNKHGGKS